MGREISAERAAWVAPSPSHDTTFLRFLAFVRRLMRGANQKINVRVRARLGGKPRKRTRGQGGGAAKPREEKNFEKKKKKKKKGKPGSDQAAAVTPIAFSAAVALLAPHLQAAAEARRRSRRHVRSVSLRTAAVILGGRLRHGHCCCTALHCTAHSARSLTLVLKKDIPLLWHVNKPVRRRVGVGAQRSSQRLGSRCTGLGDGWPRAE